MWRSFNKILDRIESRLALYGALGGSGVIAALTGYFASISSWMDAYSPFSWWVASLAGAAVGMIFFALYSWSKLRLVEARVGSDWARQAARVNPLQNQFSGCRINLVDLANPIQTQVKDKIFENCEIFGPASVVFLDGCDLDRIALVHCNIIACKPDVFAYNALQFRNVKTYRCELWKMNIFIPMTMVNKFSGKPGIEILTLTNEDVSQAREDTQS